MTMIPMGAELIEYFEVTVRTIWEYFKVLYMLLPEKKHAEYCIEQNLLRLRLIFW